MFKELETKGSILRGLVPGNSRLKEDREIERVEMTFAGTRRVRGGTEGFKY